MADEKLLANLRRIEGQVKGLQRMHTAERQCDEVLTQIMAIQAALDRVTADLVQAHTAAAFAGRSPEEAQAALVRTLRILREQ